VRAAGFELLGLGFAVLGISHSALPGSADFLPNLEVESSGQRFLLLQGLDPQDEGTWSRLKADWPTTSTELQVTGAASSPSTGLPTIHVQEYWF